MSYGPESIKAALESLHGFYRTGIIVDHCVHLQDYQTIAVIMMTEKQWPEVRTCVKRHV